MSEAQQIYDRALADAKWLQTRLGGILALAERLKDFGSLEQAAEEIEARLVAKRDEHDTIVGEAQNKAIDIIAQASAQKAEADNALAAGKQGAALMVAEAQRKVQQIRDDDAARLTKASAELDALVAAKDRHLKNIKDAADKAMGDAQMEAGIILTKARQQAAQIATDAKRAVDKELAGARDEAARLTVANKTAADNLASLQADIKKAVDRLAAVKAQIAEIKAGL